MRDEKSKVLRTLREAEAERVSAEIDTAAETARGDVRRVALSKRVGSATKDNRHGLATDHGSSPRHTESRRQGYMGRESKDKNARKNV